MLRIKSFTNAENFIKSEIIFKHMVEALRNTHMELFVSNNIQKNKKSLIDKNTFI